MSKRRLVYLSLEFRGGVWAGDQNLGVTSIEVGLKLTRWENTDKGWASGKGNWNRDGQGAFL